MFDMLYRELYYRHYYAKCSDRLTLAERRQSWTTYTELFEEILGLAFVAAGFSLSLPLSPSPPPSPSLSLFFIHLGAL